MVHQLARVATVGLHAVPGPPGDQRRRDHPVFDTRSTAGYTSLCTPPACLGSRAQGCRKAALAFWGYHPIRTNIYLDGLNLYYRALRGTPYRWLDLGKLAGLLLPQHSVGRIRYFTAAVTDRPGDPAAAQRQQAYLRALQTVPNLTIHYGHLLDKTKLRPLAQRPRTGPRIVEILDREDDVNWRRLAPYRSG